MKVALIAAFLLAPSLPEQVDTTLIASQKAQKAGETARVAYLCRKAVFRKFGYKGHDGRLYLNKEFVVRQVDACLTNGGRV